MEDLIVGFKSGSEDAVREVVRRYSGAITTVARSMVGSPELVVEVVQQTFVKAWRAAASFDESRELTPWLYSIARRTAIDVLRREGRQPVRADGEPTDGSDATFPMSFERTWEIYEVRQAVDALPEEECVVIRLSFFNGLTHEQIAELLDVPIGTVKSRSSRGRKNLAVALGHLKPPANQSRTLDVQEGDVP